jgi:hypothetical protein
MGRFAHAALFAPASATPITVGQAYQLAFHAEMCHTCMPNFLGVLRYITMDGVTGGHRCHECRVL